MAGYSVISTQKTKVLVIGKDAETHASNLHVLVRDTELEAVGEIKTVLSTWEAFSVPTTP